MNEPLGPSRRVIWIAVSLGLVAACVAWSCAEHKPEPTASDLHPTQATALPADLELQVHNFCGAQCHSYPAPDVFPRKYWRDEVFRAFKFYEDSGLSLTPPKIGDVVRYYEDRAPDAYPPAPTVAASKPLGIAFETRNYPGPGKPYCMISNVTAVKLPVGVADATALARAPITLLATDMKGGRILALQPADPSPAWRVLGKVNNPAHIEVVDLDGDGILDLLVADLGSFSPSDSRCGSVAWLRGRPDGSFASPVLLLSNVGRVADVRAARFMGSDKLDLVVGVFGLRKVGEIAILENRTTDWSKPEFVPHVLDTRPGTIHVPVIDLNGDGKPDFIALISQEHETVVAFINEGNGKFQPKTLYSAPHPAWGSSGIQLVDLNGDGKVDVLYTNGDILDEPYLWKPYHGIQWLENKGDLKFDYHRIGDLYGVHNAVAARITGGQLPDIVAVSFLPRDKFPDRAERGADAVVLFEQVARGKFERHSILKEKCDSVVCVAADLYGDDPKTPRLADLAIGNFSGMNESPVTILKNNGASKK